MQCLTVSLVGEDSIEVDSGLSKTFEVFCVFWCQLIDKDFAFLYLLCSVVKIENEHPYSFAISDCSEFGLTDSIFINLAIKISKF